MKQRRIQTGFTLIELMVVMAILVLLSVISYRALVMALDTRQVVSTYSEQLREFELGLLMLSRDLQQIHKAPLPDGARALSSQLGQGKHSSGELFRLYRAPDAEMLRGVAPVAYRLEAGTLWQYVGDGDQRFTTPIMENIVSASIAFDDQGKRYYRWQDESLPALVTLSLEHKRYGNIVISEWLYGR